MDNRLPQCDLCASRLERISVLEAALEAILEKIPAPEPWEAEVRTLAQEGLCEPPAKFDRTKYQREYMRKRRASAIPVAPDEDDL